jgi:hypothetical protein
MRGGMETRSRKAGEVAKTVKSEIEKDTAFYRGYLIDIAV